MNRMIIKRLIFLTLIVFTFQQCAKSKTDLNPEASKSIIKGAPDWYLDTPTKEGFKLVSSSATSKDMKVAINKGSLDAANTLASMVRSEMNALVKRVREETGHEDDSDLLDRFSQVQEQVVATTLEDWKVSKKNIYREKNSKGNNIFRAYATYNTIINNNYILILNFTNYWNYSFVNFNSIFVSWLNKTA